VVVILFAPGDAFEGYVIVRVLPPEGEIQRFLSRAREDGEEAGGEVLLYCRIRKKAGADEVEAFEDRVSILRGLDHAHVPRLQRAGYARGFFFWLAVEAPRGTSVREVLRADPELANLSNVIVLATQIAGAMGAALEQKVAHFGLTPEHIYVDDASLELTAVLSLGVRMALDATPVHPREEIVFRAPEQLREKHADYRADMYALGMIVYELLAGEPPHADQLRSLGVMDVALASEGIIDALVLTSPTRLCDRLDGLEASVEQFVFVLINKKPEQRPATWRHVANGLTNAGASVAMRIALQNPAERERIDGLLTKEGALTFRQLAAAYMPRRSDDVGSAPGAGEPDAEELDAEEPDVGEPDAEALQPSPEDAELPQPSPEAEAPLDVAPEPSSPSAPSAPDRPSAASSRGPAPASRGTGLMVAAFVLAGVVTAAGLLWLVAHPARFGPPPPVIVQVPAPSRDLSPAPSFVVVPQPSEERVRNAPQPRPTTAPTSVEPGAPPPPSPPLPPSHQYMKNNWWR
jgi:serine/threonine protein kinase